MEGLSNGKYKKNHGYAKRTFIHNCITEYKSSTYQVKTRFPISKYVKKNSDMLYIRVFITDGVRGLFIVPKQPIRRCNAGWHICGII